jgi:hypothetical protein
MERITNLSRNTFRLGLVLAVLAMSLWSLIALGRIHWAALLGAVALAGAVLTLGFAVMDRIEVERRAAMRRTLYVNKLGYWL